MGTEHEAVEQAQEAVDEAIARLGGDHIDVSYKLDDLAAALKQDGRLLDAANASARARTIRAARLRTEDQKQEEAFGAVRDAPLSSAGWINRLRRIAVISCMVLLAVVAVIPVKAGDMIMKDLAGSALAGFVIQLLLSRFPSVPRPVKYAAIVLGSGAIWMVLSGGR